MLSAFVLHEVKGDAPNVTLYRKKPIDLVDEEPADHVDLFSASAVSSGGRGGGGTK